MVGNILYTIKVYVRDSIVYQQCKMKYAGFGAHINFGRGEMTRADSWLTTPTGRIIKLESHRLTFLSTFNDSSLFDKPWD